MDAPWKPTAYDFRYKVCFPKTKHTTQVNKLLIVIIATLFKF